MKEKKPVALVGLIGSGFGTPYPAFLHLIRQLPFKRDRCHGLLQRTDNVLPSGIYFIAFTMKSLPAQAPKSPMCACTNSGSQSDSLNLFGDSW